MANPIFDKRHIGEYLLFGTGAAVLYIIPVVMFLAKKEYDHLYYFFIGCILFMVVIFWYVFKLLHTRYDRQRTSSMVFSGILATGAGTIISCLLVIIAMILISPAIPGNDSANLPGAATQLQSGNKGYLWGTILSTAIFGNFATGAFISLIVGYAGKRNQGGDSNAA